MAVEPKITPKLTPNKQNKQKQRPSTTHIKENDKKNARASGRTATIPFNKEYARASLDNYKHLLHINFNSRNLVTHWRVDSNNSLTTIRTKYSKKLK